MFQQTIQDLLSVADAGPRPEDLLERARTTLLGSDPFEGGEIVAETAGGVVHFPLAKGLGDLGPGLLPVLGDQDTVRMDTADDLRARGLSPLPSLGSLLLLRLEAPGATRALIALGHSRNWSFAASPFSRMRAVANLTLRLLLRAALPAKSLEEERLVAEVQRLKGLVSTLDDELVILRAERAARKDSDTPR
jgi:hypothetical protein